MKKPSFRLKYAFFLTFILVFISSCTLIPCTSDYGLDYVKENPKSDFLIGTYKLDEWTLKKTQGYNNSQNARMTIDSNGTFELINIPKGTIDINTLYYSEGKSISANGKWKTNFNDSETAEFDVDFKFDQTEIEIEDFRTSWKIYKKDKRVIIFIRVGDPDDCASVRFIKVSE